MRDAGDESVVEDDNRQIQLFVWQENLFIVLLRRATLQTDIHGIPRKLPSLGLMLDTIDIYLGQTARCKRPMKSALAKEDTVESKMLSLSNCPISGKNKRREAIARSISFSIAAFRVLSFPNKKSIRPVRLQFRYRRNNVVI